MDERRKRKTFITANRYQVQVIALTFFPAFIMVAFLYVLITIMHHDLVDVILNEAAATMARFVHRWTSMILIALGVLFLFILMWAYVMSRNLVGAFERIIRELDEVIDGEEKHPITARKNDDLANEILKRVNILIEQLPKPIAKKE